MAQPIRIILNGKKAGLEAVREAIFNARHHADIQVRVTWEGGDVERLVAEAINDKVRRIVAAGGDGTVKEVTEALMKFEPQLRPELAIMPLGTANDFASACQISNDLASALHLAQTGRAQSVDCVKAENHYFINVASGGFGAQVTSTTPLALKNFLGGGAYTLSGLAQALNFAPYAGRVHIPGLSRDLDVIVCAVCNGRQAGGGQQLAPQARINDGLLDVVALLNFPPEALTQVINELRDPQINGVYVKRYQVPWLEWEAEQGMPINLDGEAIQQQSVRFDIQPQAINLVLAETCPLVDTGSF